MVLEQLADEIFQQKEGRIRQIFREELQVILAESKPAYNKPYIPTEEACEYLSCCRKKLQDYRIDYNFKYVKRGNTYYYEVKDLDRFFQD